MTEAEWLQTSDVQQMLEAFWELHGDDEPTLVCKLHRYFLACCRRIWKLLPQEGSRRGVAVAERYLLGKATEGELSEADWHVEGAAFNIDYNCEPEAIAHWVEQTRQIPEAELRAMLHPPQSVLEIDAHELLLRAAYFADYAVIYPHLTPKRGVPDNYVVFLSADLLRELVGNPFRPRRSSRAGRDPPRE